jgi:uncharacterized membrane protein
MPTNIIYITVIASGIIVAQLTLKKGLLLLGGINFSSGVMVEVFRMLHSPYILSAFVLQGIISLVWFYVLSKAQLVYLFTMFGAFFYILLALASWIVLGERLSLIQCLGVLLISFGVVCFNYQSM